MIFLITAARGISYSRYSFFTVQPGKSKIALIQLVDIQNKDGLYSKDPPLLGDTKEELWQVYIFVQCGGSGA